MAGFILLNYPFNIIHCHTFKEIYKKNKDIKAITAALQGCIEKSYIKMIYQ